MPYRAGVAGMSAGRKTFRREGEDHRRRELVDATLASIAELGVEHTTVREIALRAGVTPGLIRHYFAGKDELVAAAYQRHVESMGTASDAAVQAAGEDPVKRLAAFVSANLSPPILGPVNLSLWAAFITLVRTDALIADVHREGYLGYRGEAERLAEAVARQAGRDPGAAAIRRLGISLNAIIDGLWLEGSMSGADFTDGELARIGLASASALLCVPLASDES